MLVSRKFINRYVDLEGLSTEEIADKLTNAGLEVEGIDILLDVDNLVVGKVLTCVPHQDSDHLHLCEIDVGHEVLPIVCGADNIAAEQIVIVAKEGAVLPGDFKIKESEIRGAVSKGMVCSLDELGIADKFSDAENDGIYVFENENEIEIGMNAVEALGMKDEVMDVKQTPNRSDFLSMFAIAHELSALYDRELTLPSLKRPKVKESKTDVAVKIESDLCHQFIAKKVNHVKIKPSPKWLQEILIASGIKPINNVVDISNLVMLETGQPIHYYDARYIDGTMSISDSFSGEVTALDDKQYKIEPSTLMIMKDDEPIGIAGVMGLGNSMIQDDTSSIVIEIGSFDRVSVRQTASKLGLNTEASIRFSKPMDPLAHEKAMARSMQLLMEYAQAEGFEEDVKAGNVAYTAKTITTDINRINKLLGTDFSEEEVIDVFARLHLEPKKEKEAIIVTVPSFRDDLEIPEDLSEEVIRILGYDRLPETLPKMDLTMGNLTESQQFIRFLEDLLLSVGAHQTVTYTLESGKNADEILSLGEKIKLLSPLSDQRAYLRTQLLPSMVKMLSYNQARQNADGLYFEHSRVYAKDKAETRLAIIGQGELFKKNWNKDQVFVDFFTVKGIFMETMTRLGFQEARFQFVTYDQENEIFNPFKTAKILFDRKEIGVIGHLHPVLTEAKDLNDTVYLEVNCDPLIASKSGRVKAEPVAKHHDILRDLAILVDKSVTAQDLMTTIKKTGRRDLKSIDVFDVFESKELADRRSIAFELRFDGSAFKSSEAVTQVMEKIEKALVDKHQAMIR